MGGTTLLTHLPAPALAPYISAIHDYSSGCMPLTVQAASLDVPVIVCLTGDFRIAFDRHPGPGDRIASFASGLHPGTVAIDSDSGAACVQVNFTPLGARLALARPMDALAGRLVPLDDLDLDPTGGSLGTASQTCDPRPAPRPCRGLGRAPHRRRPRGRGCGGPQQRLRLPPAPAQPRPCPGRRPRRTHWLEPQAPRRPLPRRLWPDPEATRPHPALPPCRGACRSRPTRLGRHRRGLRLCRPASPRARIPPPRRPHPDRLTQIFKTARRLAR